MYFLTFLFLHIIILIIITIIIIIIIVIIIIIISFYNRCWLSNRSLLFEGSFIGFWLSYPW